MLLQSSLKKRFQNQVLAVGRELMFAVHRNTYSMVRLENNEEDSSDESGVTDLFI